MSEQQTVLPQRTLGKTGLNVSLLGLGLVKIGRNEGVKYPQPFALPSDDMVLELLATAAELGITLLDTAPAYGHSEARLGEALRQLPELANRCVISTKVGETFADGTSSFDFSADAIRKSVERSLERLRRDTLDIVLVHSSGDDRAVLANEQPLATLQTLQQEGLIRACGFSGKTLTGGRLALELGAQVLMITLNAQHRQEYPLLAEAKKRGAGIVIKKPLASGHGTPTALTELAGEAVSALVVGTLNPAHLRANAALLGPLKGSP